MEFKHEEKMEVLSEEGLLRPVQLKIAESDTMWLLDLPNICAMADTEEAVIVKEKNLQYMEVGRH